MEVKHFELLPRSKYSIHLIPARYIVDEGWAVGDDRSDIEVYTNGTHISFRDKVWRIPTHYKDPECVNAYLCPDTDNVIVDILVA